MVSINTTSCPGAQSTEPDARNVEALVYVNGKFVPRAEATVSVFDAGYVCGDGVWEGVRIVRGRVIALDAHLDRLHEGARAIAMDIGMSRDQLREVIRSTFAANEIDDGGHARLMVTRGVKTTPNQDPRSVLGAPTVVCVAERKVVSAQAKQRGLTLFTSTFRCSTPDVFDLRLNSHSRLNLIQALIQALQAGADEALMLDTQGFVSSCNSTNFFLVRGDQLWTSSGRGRTARRHDPRPGQRPVGAAGVQRRTPPGPAPHQACCGLGRFDVGAGLYARAGSGALIQPPGRAQFAS